MDEMPLPSLYGNGSLDPDKWRPDFDNSNRKIAGEGDLVGWRYGAWRVIEVRLKDDGNIAVVLRHESGPLILRNGEPSQRLHDGSITIHLGVKPPGYIQTAMREPYKTCSCHGHIWPCQDIDRNTLALHEARKFDKLMATTEPGVCAHCLEVITTRQKTVTFPEGSRLVPGAPGPTFHAGRSDCWGAAERYEREGRLVDDPDTARIASCPGVRFIHEQHGIPAERRLECTAGPFCTGLHGPSGYRNDPPCWSQIHLASDDGAYARPGTDCGYRGAHGPCLGGDLSGGGTSISPIAADLIWAARLRHEGGADRG
jgi:hypothetical protein